jgi:hypothetical protein
MELPLEIWSHVFDIARDDLWLSLRAHPCYNFNNEEQDYVPGTETINGFWALGLACRSFAAEARRRQMDGPRIRLTRRLFDLNTGPSGAPGLQVFTMLIGTVGIYYNSLTHFMCLKIWNTFAEELIPTSGANRAPIVTIIFYNLYLGSSPGCNATAFAQCTYSAAKLRPCDIKGILGGTLFISEDSYKIKDELGGHFIYCGPDIGQKLWSFIEKNI